MNGSQNRNDAFSFSSIVASMSTENFSQLGQWLFEDIRFVANKGAGRNVYCDMDGVLANFLLGIRTYYPDLKTEKEVNEFLNRPNAWNMVAKDHPNIFADLPMLPDAQQLISTLKQLDKTGKINLFFLTALPPNLLHTRAVKDKKEWIRSHFNLSPKRVIVTRRKDKAKFAMIDKMEGRPASILIDDFKKNIDEWHQASGVGVRHVSANRTISQLKDFLRVT